MFRRVRMVISWFVRWGEHATFAAEVAKFFGLWKMVISTEVGLLAALAEWYEASPFWFGAVGFAITLVIINVGWSLYNKWKIHEYKMFAARPKAVSHEIDRRALIAKARDFVVMTMRQDKGYAYFQHALESSEIYLKLRPYLKEDFHRALTSGFVIVAPLRASDMPGIECWLRLFEQLPRFDKWSSCQG